MVWVLRTESQILLHCVYGNKKKVVLTVTVYFFQVFLQTATCLEVTTYMRVEEGLTMVLTGSTPSTGEWDLHFAKQATGAIATIFVLVTVVAAVVVRLAVLVEV